MGGVLLIYCNFEPVDTARGLAMYHYFCERMPTKLVYSSYSHVHKTYIVHDNADFIPVRCFPYKKNLSLSRIASYLDFAFKIRKIIREEHPDLLYVQVPPNCVGFFAARQAKKMHIPVVLDVVDLWPESLPFSRRIKKAVGLTVGRAWKYFRSSAVKKCDILLSESDYFLNLLDLQDKKGSVIHLTKYARPLSPDFSVLSRDKIVIVFLGSINFISDFDSLISLAAGLQQEGRDVELGIIGDGINREKLLLELGNLSIPYVYYGKVFDESKKRAILQNAWFGFNGYKTSTEVALSYKSIDYFSNSLPLISNVKGDTWKIIENNHVGFNYTAENLREIVETISGLTFRDIVDMKKESSRVFQEYFSYPVFERNLDVILNRAGKMPVPLKASEKPPRRENSEIYRKRYTEI